jgi:hypothetical protein
MLNEIPEGAWPFPASNAAAFARANPPAQQVSWNPDAWASYGAESQALIKKGFMAALDLAYTAERADSSAFAIPSLNEGEHYAGLLLSDDGTPMHHLVLLPGDEAAVTWNEAQDFAARIGGELPTRREQSLLFANVPQHFERTTYWSGEQYSAHNAWTQGFAGGGQGYWGKDGKLRARVVRRLLID